MVKRRRHTPDQVYTPATRSDFGGVAWIQTAPHLVTHERARDQASKDKLSHQGRGERRTVRQGLRAPGAPAPGRLRASVALCLLHSG